MTIGEQLLEQRKKLGLSQSALHHEAKISLDTLRRIEKDRSKNPSHFVITALEKALDFKFVIWK